MFRLSHCMQYHVMLCWIMISSWTHNRPIISGYLQSNLSYMPLQIPKLICFSLVSNVVLYIILTKSILSYCNIWPHGVNTRLYYRNVVEVLLNYSTHLSCFWFQNTVCLLDTTFHLTCVITALVSNMNMMQWFWFTVTQNLKHPLHFI